MILDRDKEPKPPYVHQDYPGCRYKPTGEFVMVNHAEEDAVASAAGFERTPPPPEIACVLVKLPAPKAKKPAPAVAGPAAPTLRR